MYIDCVYEGRKEGASSLFDAFQVEIGDEEEMNNLINALNNVNNAAYYWLALRDVEQEGVWVWETSREAKIRILIL